MTQTFPFRGRERSSVTVKLSQVNTADRLLVRINEEAPYSIKELICGEEGFGKSNVYDLVNQARAKGLVKPKPSAELTEAGRQRVQDLGAREPIDVDFCTELLEDVPC